MNLEFKKVNLDHLDICLKFRKDSYFCSFGSMDGALAELGENGEIYFSKMKERINDPQWNFIHVWHHQEIIGQIEFRNFSDLFGFGYVHLFYIKPEYRGVGLFKQLDEYVKKTLSSQKCRGVMLSVSQTNLRALKTYEQHGWKYYSQNPKKELLAFYSKIF